MYLVFQYHILFRYMYRIYIMYVFTILYNDLYTYIVVYTYIHIYICPYHMPNAGRFYTHSKHSMFQSMSFHLGFAGDEGWGQRHLGRTRNDSWKGDKSGGLRKSYTILVARLWSLAIWWSIGTSIGIISLNRRRKFTERTWVMHTCMYVYIYIMVSYHVHQRNKLSS